MNSFILKDFSGGFSDFEDRGIAGSFKLGINLDIRKAINSLSCNQDLIQEGGDVVVGLIRWWVPCTDGNTYGFDGSGNIYKRTSGGTYTKVYTDPDGAITGAAEWFCSNGKTYIFWATATKLHCKEIPGNATWSVDKDASVVVGSNTYTYPKTNLTTATWHTMAQAVGSLLIANYDYIGYVGWDGSYNQLGLNIFKKNYVKALIERGSYVIAGCPKVDNSPESNIIAWDTDAYSYNDKKNLVGGAINAMIDTDIPLLQVGTKGGIYYGDMQNVLPITSIPGGGYCNPGGVTNDDGLALFGIYGNTESRNGIYSYGKKKLNQSRTLNLEYYVGECDEIGAICKTGTDILVSYRVGSTNYVKKANTALKATAYYYSLDLKAPSRLNYMPLWNSIVLTTKAMPANTKVEVFYKLDKSTRTVDNVAVEWIQARMESKNNDGTGKKEFDTTNGTEAVFLVGEKAKVIEVQIKLTPYGNTTPEVNKAEIYFE